ncbi:MULTISPECIES: DNA polymerase III subunit delta' [Marichromatium]|uniref:DNA polymerase III subunit delta' n=1 Tax=Marichromatium gracile TaxID=1048 RepID=A0A4R4AA82_MARGR|nr:MULTISPECIES: DNA polymerase III subunit delta' [Marichromatium]MBK1708187.1 DNA polymerase III subunit delta' [Marichromatium gracile]RNE94657.1 DNA polymerase III subunit delta' [Marichromatium sp. AB32]TCW35868.1 DNA polymerase-3 subunit delta' [Marichromatium gracile]
MSQGRDRLPSWLAAPWARLQQARAADRLPHALLLSGPAGVGKRALLERFSRALLCAAPDTEGQACGRCAECVLLAAGNHPDLVRVGPDPESKSGDIPIAAIRTLCAGEALTPSRVARRVVLIDPADHLNAAAANALLKTLEEPVGRTLLCLVAEHPERLPATIRSRCQQLRIALPAEAEALAWLRGRLPDEQAALALRLAHGAPLAALDRLDPERLEARAQRLQGFIALARGERAPLAEAAAWNKLGAALLLEWMAGWLCDLLRLGASATPPRLDNPDQREALAALASRLDPVAAHRFFRRVLEARTQCEGSVNAQLLLESLAIEWRELAVSGRAASA